MQPGHELEQGEPVGDVPIGVLVACGRVGPMAFIELNAQRVSLGTTFGSPLRMDFEGRLAPEVCKCARLDDLVPIAGSQRWSSWNPTGKDPFDHSVFTVFSFGCANGAAQRKQI
jgi:hypothetical protein